VSDRSDLFARGPDSTLALLLYCATALALIVLDRRLNYLTDFRVSVQNWVAPVWVLASLPREAWRAGSGYVGDRARLQEENEQLRIAYLTQQQELIRYRSESNATQRLGLLSSFIEQHAEQRPELVGGILARVLDIDLDQRGQYVVLDRGSSSGVQPGSILLDEHGVVGQISLLAKTSAQAILITDSKHRLPAQNDRGERFFLSGTNRVDQLLIERLPPTSDLKVGDLISTSGLGGVFPEGLPIGKLIEVEEMVSQGMRRATVQLNSRMGYLREVYVLAPMPAVGPVALATSADPPAIAPPAPNSSAPSATTAEATPDSRSQNP
jgi:rod shape-determining protein MreC